MCVCVRTNVNLTLLTTLQHDHTCVYAGKVQFRTLQAKHLVTQAADWLLHCSGNQAGLTATATQP